MLYFDTIDWNVQSVNPILNTLIHFGYLGVVFNKFMNIPANWRSQQKNSWSIPLDTRCVHIPLKRMNIQCIEPTTFCDHINSCSSVSNKFSPLPYMCRVTIPVHTKDDISFVNLLSGYNLYDIIAVAPQNEKAWLAILNEGEFDLVTLDLTSSYLQFPLKRKHLQQLFNRNIFIEIRLAEIIKSSIARSFFFSNMTNIISFGSHDHFIFSSGASDPLEVRAPLDVVNLAHILGVKKNCFQIISTNYLLCFNKGIARRTFGGSVYAVDSQII